MYSFCVGSGNTLVKYEISNIGDDIEIHIGGGCLHIGAIALVSEGNYDILSVRNHKEYEIIQPLADCLTKYEDFSILVVAGIHIDDISLDEIKEILDNNLVAINKIDDFLCKEYEIFHEFT